MTTAINQREHAKMMKAVNIQYNKWKRSLTTHQKNNLWFVLKRKKGGIVMDRNYATAKWGHLYEYRNVDISVPMVGLGAAAVFGMGSRFQYVSPPNEKKTNNELSKIMAEHNNKEGQGLYWGNTIHHSAFTNKKFKVTLAIMSLNNEGKKVLKDYCEEVDKWDRIGAGMDTMWKDTPLCEDVMGEIVSYL